MVPENLFKKIPRKLIDKHHVVPIRLHDGVLTVATSDPYPDPRLGDPKRWEKKPVE